MSEVIPIIIIIVDDNFIQPEKTNGFATLTSFANGKIGTKVTINAPINA